MKHRKKGAKLNRTAEHREAMFRNMASSLILHGRVQTTVAKAKALRPYVEPLITKAKRGDLHARRLVGRRIHNKEALAKLFDEVGPKMAERNGGYTRVLQLGPRAGDGAEMAIIELVD